MPICPYHRRSTSCYLSSLSSLPLQFELLICIGEATDPPSLGVVQELMVQYPAARVRVFQGTAYVCVCVWSSPYAYTGGENAGVNPKINNMMPAYKSAQYNLVWICDSNILSE